MAVRTDIDDLRVDTNSLRSDTDSERADPVDDRVRSGPERADTEASSVASPGIPVREAADMTLPVGSLSTGQMFHRVQKVLHLNQKELAEVLGLSPRTISRYYDHGGVLLPSSYVKLATRCHPHDREMAVYLATLAGHTLETLGLEQPPAPPPPVEPPAPAPALPAASHMADSVVCAGAEALQMSPHAMRTALVAAFGRAVALGMSAEQVLAAMLPEKKRRPTLR